ncbi:MAG: FHA domain-containing protein [Anaerolineae bacterium]|nr:FHA domain-containing protein [Anaerolineae bacterium]
MSEQPLAYLVLQSSSSQETGDQPPTFDITVPEITIGQAANADWRLTGFPDLEKLHCAIQYDSASGSYLLQDHYSEVGTYLNNQWVDPLRTYPLAHGDVIRLGREDWEPVILKFLLQNTADNVERTALDPTLRAPTVFLSFSAADLDVGSWLTRQLQHSLKNVTIWGQDYHLPEPDFQSEVAPMVSQSYILLVLLTPGALVSAAVRQHLAVADRLRVAITLVLIEGEPAQYNTWLTRYPDWFDLREAWQGNDASFLEALQNTLIHRLNLTP